MSNVEVGGEVFTSTFCSIMGMAVEARLRAATTWHAAGTSAHRTGRLLLEGRVPPRPRPRKGEREDRVSGFTPVFYFWLSSACLLLWVSPRRFALCGDVTQADTWNGQPTDMLHLWACVAEPLRHRGAVRRAGLRGVLLQFALASEQSSLPRARIPGDGASHLRRNSWRECGGQNHE